MVVGLGFSLTMATEFTKNDWIGYKLRGKSSSCNMNGTSKVVITSNGNTFFGEIRYPTIVIKTKGDFIWHEKFKIYADTLNINGEDIKSDLFSSFTKSGLSSSARMNFSQESYSENDEIFLEKLKNKKA